MVTIPELWLPIVVAAVLVFAASSVIHMFLGYHAGDLDPVPAEERARAALRELGLSPGSYAIPKAGSMKEMSDPAFVAKQEEGPVALLTVLPSGPFRLGPTLGQWFLFLIGVGIFVAYVSGRTLGAGTEYLRVFQVTGAVAFVAYGVGSWSESIWFGRKWSTTLKNTADGLVYALLTAGSFAWLWP